MTEFENGRWLGLGGDGLVALGEVALLSPSVPFPLSPCRHQKAFPYRKEEGHHQEVNKPVPWPQTSQVLNSER